MRTLITLALLSSLTLLTPACGGEKAAPAAASAPEVYTVRGLVKGVTGDEVSFQHEAIPAFKGRDGKAADMASMTMSFGIGDGIDRALLKPGAPVTMTFEVRWTERPALKATKVEALPSTTELTLE